MLAGAEDDGGVDEGGAEDGGGLDDGGEDDGGEDDGGADEGGGEDGGGDEGGAEDGGGEDGGGEDGGADEGGAEDDDGLGGGEDLVGVPDPDPDPDPAGCADAELAGTVPGCVALIGVGASDVLNLEAGGLRKELGDRGALGDALAPAGVSAPRAGAVAGLPADACGWSGPAAGVRFAPIRAKAATADPATTPAVRPAEASGREIRCRPGRPAPPALTRPPRRGGRGESGVAQGSIGADSEVPVGATISASSAGAAADGV